MAKTVNFRVGHVKTARHVITLMDAAQMDVQKDGLEKNVKLVSTFSIQAILYDYI
jgi:hypothetical protein